MAPVISRKDVDEFLSRPLGGVEIESFIAANEISYFAWYGLFGQWAISGGELAYIVGWTFLASALMTIAGLWFFARKDKKCAPLRWFGALVSIMLWSIMAVDVHWIFLLNAMAETRIMMSAWRRPWPGHGV